MGERLVRRPAPVGHRATAPRVRWTTSLSSPRGWSSTSATSTRSTASISLCLPEPCSVCSVRTAPARRPPSASSRRSCAPTPGVPPCSASTSPPIPQQVRASLGLTGQYAAVDENLTGRENLVLVGRLTHLPKRDIGPPRRRAARAVRSRRRRRPPGQDLLGRHAPPARSRRRARPSPAGAVPRRAHDRSRPAGHAPNCGW